MSVATDRFSYIKDLGLKLARTPAKRAKTERILIHHFGANSTVPAVHEYHISRGHAAIDYNIVVQSDGTIVWGRGLDYAGGSVNNANTATAGMNATSVAIALQGDREHEPMPEAQWKALCRVVRDLCDYYGLHTKAAIRGHNEVAGRSYTDCPGRYTDMDALRTYALGSAPVPADPQPAEPSVADPKIVPADFAKCAKLTSPMERSDRVRWLQIRLDRHHADPKGVDGVFGPNTEAAVIRFQQARINEGRDIGGPIVNGRQQPDGKVGIKTAAILAE